MSDRLTDKVHRKARKLLRRQAVHCNFCGQRFVSYDTPYSESQECPHCGSVARERVIYEVILERYCPDSTSLAKAGEQLKSVAVLEMSPRNLPQKRELYNRVFKKYTASDYDQKGHLGDVKLDLTNNKDAAVLASQFDVVICAHVMEHIPAYEKAIANLTKLIKKNGMVLFQVPFIESRYTPITWEEYHGDNTKAYHRFSFDISPVFSKYFRRVDLYLASKQPKIVSSDVDSRKYQALGHHNGKITEFSARAMKRAGLGAADMCEVYVLGNDPA